MDYEYGLMIKRMIQLGLKHILIFIMIYGSVGNVIRKNRNKIKIKSRKTLV